MSEMYTRLTHFEDCGLHILSPNQELFEKAMKAYFGKTYTLTPYQRRGKWTGEAIEAFKEAFNCPLRSVIGREYYHIIPCDIRVKTGTVIVREDDMIITMSPADITGVKNPHYVPKEWEIRSNKFFHETLVGRIRGFHIQCGAETCDALKVNIQLHQVEYGIPHTKALWDEEHHVQLNSKEYWDMLISGGPYKRPGKKLGEITYPINRPKE